MRAISGAGCVRDVIATGASVRLGLVLVNYTPTNPDRLRSGLMGAVVEFSRELAPRRACQPRSTGPATHQHVKHNSTRFVHCYHIHSDKLCT